MNNKLIFNVCIIVVSGKVYLAKEVVTHQLGTKDKADFLTLEAAVMFIPKERAVYQACANKDCKKKVNVIFIIDFQMCL